MCLVLAPSVAGDWYVPTLKSSPPGLAGGIHQQRSADYALVVHPYRGYIPALERHILYTELGANVLFQEAKSQL